MSATFNQDVINALEPIVEALQAYHCYEVVGIDHVPDEGPALIVANHSLATYDVTLLLGRIYQEKGRVVRSLIDRLFYKIPFLGDIMSMTGAVKGDPDTALRLLASGELVCVAPGGMYEALRPSDHRYEVCWDRRKGFAKLAINSGAPVILAACPRADDLYDLYDNPVTPWFYKKFKVPVFLARGLGPTPIPKPIKLVHYLSEPIIPPKPSGNEAARKAQATRFHRKLIKRMEALMQDALKHEA